MTPEALEMRRIMLAVSAEGVRVFRNNVGMGWAGKPVVVAREMMRVTLGPGDVVVRNARPLHAGLCPGSSDLIGWTPLLIRAEHAGRTFPIFTGLEVKRPGGGRFEDDQRTFGEVVSGAGGVFGVVRSAKEALMLIHSLGS